MSSNPLLAIQSQYWQVRDYLSPVLKQSAFKQHGRITPDEFVAAGDLLCERFGMWEWQKGDPSRKRDFLPDDKQYLISRNVPCFRRANAVNYTDEEEDGERLVNFLDDAEEAVGPDGKRRSEAGAGVADGEEDWVETHVGRTSHKMDESTMGEIPDMDEPTHETSGTSSQVPTSTASQLPNLAKLSVADGAQQTHNDDHAIPDLDDIPDMDDEGMEEEEDVAAVAQPVRAAMEAQSNDPNQAASSIKPNLLSVRTYDCFISYDKHYQTPRFWLLGYDENKNPLTPAQVFEDVPSDHAFKTMTMEAFPHSGQPLASVHPCKHASVMKKFIDRMDSAAAASAMGRDSEQAAEVESKTAAEGGSSGKKKWGLGGMVRRVTGGGVSQASQQQQMPAKKDSAGDEGDQVAGLQVDFYLVIFLKFIASIVPTIEVDSTTAF